MSSDTPMRNRNNPEERMMASIRQRAYDGDAMEKAVLAAQCGEVTVLVRQLRHDLAAMTARAEAAGRDAEPVAILAEINRHIEALEARGISAMSSIDSARKARADLLARYAAPQSAQADEALTCSDAREERVGCYRAVRAENRADEAVALLREVVRRYDDYRGKGVMPAPGEYQMVVGVIERIRAFLKDRT